MEICLYISLTVVYMYNPSPSVGFLLGLHDIFVGFFKFGLPMASNTSIDMAETPALVSILKQTFSYPFAVGYTLILFLSCYPVCYSI